MGAPVWSRGCGASAALHVTVSERALRAVVTDSEWRRRPTVCPTAHGGARCTAPLHSACPPAARPLGPLLRPPRPEEFSASGGKNRLCSEPRIISARRTAPLRPHRRGRKAGAGAAVKRTLRALRLRRHLPTHDLFLNSRMQTPACELPLRSIIEEK
ncbi:unnamed protein product [Leptosia nina]|uniref:Uncharacterized protein n=1 Tax=Leptosia nina TaxID=320188 RepID=A0AAV1JBN9_9NEOP